MKKKILVILGPTATGKSDIAVKLAQIFNGEIIGADSRQVYKELNLASGKITKKEMGGIKHYLLDVADLNNDFSVAIFKDLTVKAINEIWAKGKVPIICGGTGFYIESIVKNISMPEVPANKELRGKLSKKSTMELFEILSKLDPKRAEKIDKNNPVRLIRAIEIAIKLGNIPQNTMGEPIADFIQIGLDLPDNILKEKILKRINDRLNVGMIEEIEDILKSGIREKKLSSLGLEPRHILRFLKKEVTKEQMIADLFKDTWAFAKRQRTWFKRDKDIKWFKKEEKDIEKIADSIKERL
ncbi:MAG: tRNA (adenosine(37)-N6)-dimethylallyltransferase MiaA [Candidatus Paceibacterota bacterium]|jgi:tRNA dimethylallyltransferase